MSVPDLLADLGKLGIEIGVERGRLWCHPQRAVTPDLVERLNTHKSELLVALRSKDRDRPTKRPSDEIVILGGPVAAGRGRHATC